MKYGRVILKRANTIMEEAILTSEQITFEISEKLCVEIFDGKKALISAGVLVIEPGGKLIINEDDYHIVYSK